VVIFDQISVSGRIVCTKRKDNLRRFSLSRRYATSEPGVFQKIQLRDFWRAAGRRRSPKM
jgi:hypothetical protein